jgi:hypothetical protein
MHKYLFPILKCAQLYMFINIFGERENCRSILALKSLLNAKISSDEKSSFNFVVPKSANQVYSQ